MALDGFMSLFIYCFLSNTKNIAVVNNTISLTLFQYKHILINFDQKTAFEHAFMLLKLPSTFNVIELTRGPYWRNIGRVLFFAGL